MAAHGRVRTPLAYPTRSRATPLAQREWGGCVSDHPTRDPQWGFPVGWPSPQWGSKTPQWGGRSTPLGNQNPPLGKTKHHTGKQNTTLGKTKHHTGENKTPHWGKQNTTLGKTKHHTGEKKEPTGPAPPKDSTRRGRTPQWAPFFPQCGVLFSPVWCFVFPSVVFCFPQCGVLFSPVGCFATPVGSFVLPTGVFWICQWGVLLPHWGDGHPTGKPHWGAHHPSGVEATPLANCEWGGPTPVATTSGVVTTPTDTAVRGHLTRGTFLHPSS